LKEELDGRLRNARIFPVFREKNGSGLSAGVIPELVKNRIH
jgi:hypothetical protein